VPAAMLAHATTLGFPERSRRFIVRSLVGALFLMTLPGLLGSRGQDLALVYGSHTFAFLLLLTNVCLVLWHSLRFPGKN
jgi:alpha-1,2-mannosyltransferase